MSLFRASPLLRMTRALLRPSPLRPATALLSPLLPQLRRLSDDTRSTIDRVLGETPVVLFMKGTPEEPRCGFSKASVQILGLQGVDPNKFSAVDVMEHEEIRQGIKEFSNWPTIPQLYINKEFIGGCDILIAMHQSGELAELLEKEEVLVSMVEEPSAGEDQIPK